MALIDLFKKEEKKPDIAAILPQQIYEEGVLELRDVVAPSALKISPREINLGDKIARTFFIMSYPRFLTDSWFAPIINLDRIFDISIFIHPIETSAVLRKFQKKVAEVQSQIIAREQKGLVRDPILDTAYRDIEKLRDDLQQAQEKIFDVGVYITLYANSLQELDKAESEIKSILESRLVYVKPALFQQEGGFKSVLPIGKDELKINSKLNSTPLASIFPFVSFDLTSDRGILFGVNRHNASLILFDRFSLENYNSVVFAKSGAGKSVGYDEPVLYQENGVVKRGSIGPLIEGLIRTRGITYRDDELEGVGDPGIKVLSFDRAMRLRWSRVSVAARKEAPRERYIFRTKSGREVSTTADHNMLLLREGKVVAARSEEVRVGEYVPLPRRIEVGGAALTEAEGFALTPPFGAFLGWIAAEGSFTDRSVVISNTDPEALAHLTRLCEALGVRHGVNRRWVACYGKDLVARLHKLGASGLSGEKRVAPALFGASKETIRAFLQSYFEGDGGVERSAITAVSKSKELISGIAYLLYYFGIIARVHKRRKRYAKTGGLRTFWQLSISGQSQLTTFRDSIGFVTVRKNALLSALIGAPENTNWDAVPGLAPLASELMELFGGHVGNMPELSALRHGHHFSPKRLERLAEALEERVALFEAAAPLFAHLSRLPLIEGVVSRARHERALNHLLADALGSSWFTVKQGMPPRARNALKILTVAGENAPQSIGELKELVAEGAERAGTPQNAFDRFLSLSLRGGRNNSSYDCLRRAALFMAHSYEETQGRLSRVREIIATLKRLARADLAWDPIVVIERKPERHPYVYDLSVDDEVFLTGTAGMFVHNSYATKLEILRTLMFDTEVIVIDPEKEYEYLAEAVGGRYFNISLTSEHHINPFDLPPAREDESPGEILRSNIVNLVGLFRIMLGGLSPEEDALIDRAITETYALKDITGESDFSRIEPPLLSDFELVLAGMEGSESLVQRLSKYTKGTWAGFINQPTNVDINKKFVVFSVRDMEDDLKPVAMYIVTHYIWNAIRKNLKKRLLVIDEAWWMMKSEDTASFLYSMAKRGRKYYLGLATITQDVDDFLKSPYGLPMITNSSLQLLLKQSPTVIDRVQKVFNLSDEEKYLLLESDVGEGIFFAGLKHVALKVIASYTEDQIITSDPSQVLALKKVREAGAP